MQLSPPYSKTFIKKKIHLVQHCNSQYSGLPWSTFNKLPFRITSVISVTVIVQVQVLTGAGAGDKEHALILPETASVYKRLQTAAAPAPSSLYSRHRSQPSVAVWAPVELISAGLCLLGLEWCSALVCLYDRQAPYYKLKMIIFVQMCSFSLCLVKG